MTTKNRVQVVIGNKVLTMGGTEDEVLIQKVATHVNRKLQELEETDAYRSLPADLKPVLVELNIAEELILAQEEIHQLKTDLRLKEDQLAEVKQELVDTRMKLERVEGKKRR